MAGDVIPQAKACTKCGEVKPLAEYYALKTVKDGRRSRCKSCEKSIALTYFRENRTECLKKCQIRYAADSEKFRKRASDWHEKNKARANKRSRDWKAKNPAAVSEYNKKYYSDNKTEGKDRFKEWVNDNLLRRKEYMRFWRDENPEKGREYARRRLQNVRCRIENAMRCRIWGSIKQGSKRGRKSLSLLGYTVEQLKAHLERQFLPGMNWDNYGEWHIDHVLPLSSFDYTTPDDDDFKAAWSLTNLRPLWKSENLKKGAKRLTLL